MLFYGHCADASDNLCSVVMPDGGNPLTQEEQSEYLLWKNVFSAVRHGRRNEVRFYVARACSF
jgi:hypothetical protein